MAVLIIGLGAYLWSVWPGSCSVGKRAFKGEAFLKRCNFRRKLYQFLFLLIQCYVLLMFFGLLINFMHVPREKVLWF